MVLIVKKNTSNENTVTFDEVRVDSKFVVPRLTTIQRNATGAENGDIIYNIDSSLFEMYENGTWKVVTTGTVGTDIMTLSTDQIATGKKQFNNFIGIGVDPTTSLEISNVNPVIKINATNDSAIQFNSANQDLINFSFNSMDIHAQTGSNNLDFRQAGTNILSIDSVNKNVGIGAGVIPQPDAVLTLVSPGSDKMMLLPRVTAANEPSLPTSTSYYGGMWYNSDTNKFRVQEGGTVRELHHTGTTNISATQISGGLVSNSNFDNISGLTSQAVDTASDQTLTGYKTLRHSGSDKFDTLILENTSSNAGTSRAVGITMKAIKDDDAINEWSIASDGIKPALCINNFSELPGSSALKLCISNDGIDLPQSGQTYKINNVPITQTAATLTNKTLDFNNNTLVNVLSSNTNQNVLGYKTFLHTGSDKFDTVILQNNSGSSGTSRAVGITMKAIKDDDAINEWSLGADGVKPSLCVNNFSELPGAGALKLCISNDGIDLPQTGQSYKIESTEVISLTSLGTTVLNSSLTSLGTLSSINIASGQGYKIDSDIILEKDKITFKGAPLIDYNINLVGASPAVTQLQFKNDSGIVFYYDTNSDITANGNINLSNSARSYQIGGFDVITNNTLAAQITTANIQTNNTDFKIKKDDSSILFENAGDTDKWQIRHNTSSNDLELFHNGGDIDFTFMDNGRFLAKELDVQDSSGNTDIRMISSDTTQEYRLRVPSNGSVFRIRDHTGSQSLVDFNSSGLNIVTGNLLINGTQILTSQQPAISDSVGGDEQAKINAILSMMRTHGIIAT